MWKYSNRTILENKSWTDDNGITHPRNWHIWSAEDKASHGLIEVTPETPPDDRLYTWSYEADGVTISATAKALDGVKDTLKEEVKLQQGGLLAQTDWTVVRKSEKDTAIPSAISTWRNAIRAKATAMEDAIDAAADIDAIAALFITYHEDGNRSGTLYEWPELVR
jgi:hypothetical protein